MGNDVETAKTRSFIDFIHPGDRAGVIQNHLRSLRGEVVDDRYQFRVLHKNGTVRWVEVTGVPFEWQKEPATLNFLTDVTERREAEQEMRLALRRERELSELKSRFVAVASHEFRTPLAAILSSVELLDSYGDRLPADERQEMLTQIKTGVARMNDMVDQVLLTSKIESGRFEFMPATPLHPRPAGANHRRDGQGTPAGHAHRN
jgi:signal transduction histidine kinase